MPLDTDRLAVLIVVEHNFRQFDDHGITIAKFILESATRSYNLLRRDAIDSFRPWTHEFNPAARHDEGLETVCTQACKELEEELHRIKNAKI